MCSNIFQNLLNTLPLLLSFLILQIFLQQVNTQTKKNNLYSQQIRTQYKGLTKFSISNMNFSGNSKIITFGGLYLKNNTPQNIILQSKPFVYSNTGSSSSSNNISTTVYNTNIHKPQPRYDHCTLVYEYKMYIYGGYTVIGNQSYVLSDLWEFNTIFLTWTYIANSGKEILECNIVRNQTGIVVFGVEKYQGGGDITNSSSTTSQNTQKYRMVIIRYSLLTNIWSQLTYNYAESIQISGNMWYTDTNYSRIDVLLSVQNISPNDNQNITKNNIVYKFSNNLYTDYLHVLRYHEVGGNISAGCTNSSSTGGSSGNSGSNTVPNFCPTNYTYFLITDSKILYINLVNMRIFLVKTISSYELNAKILDCEITDKLLFVFKLIDIQNQSGVKSTYKVIVMDYYSLTNFNDFGKNYYKIPAEQILQNNLTQLQEENLSYKTLIVNNDIYIISEITLSNWIIFQNCDLLLINSSNSSTGQNQSITAHINSCFYDQIHCQMGWRGAKCQEPICPNTLYLYDELKNQQILYQCTNHGSCVQGRCVCDQFWTGQDCSIYKRKECFGVLEYNWPVMNCQCKEVASGGNSCEILFCYNDCTGHGECVNGVCYCEAKYYGMDCSITVIQFPGSEIKI